MPHCATDTLDVITDLAEAEALWREHIPCETIFDLWEVRSSFHPHYRRPLRFLFRSSQAGAGTTFLPLSWVEERKAWCFFPGETWGSKTWLEQNRLLLGSLDAAGLQRLLGADFHLRYLAQPPPGPVSCPVDETDYLFYPPHYQYRIENWLHSFTHKRGKKLRRDWASIEQQGVTFRYDEENRFDLMVAMNLERFGPASYYADPRFLEGFRSMFACLANMNLLRVTTLYCANTVAAIDFGSVFKGRYTLLAGGTDARFPGVAKLINLHHIEWACDRHLDEVDFMCGDFSWKPLFHLTPKPLYLLHSP